MSSVAIIDYGMGNLHSMAKALEHVRPDGMAVEVTSQPEQILAAERVVLPGVGAIRDCMGELERLGLAKVVRDIVDTRPLLGVCVGLQVLLDHSEENGGVACLGVLPGQVKRFPQPLVNGDGARLKVPHMGWNEVSRAREHPLWQGIPQDTRFYFVHSFFVAPDDEELSAATTHYPLPFTSAVSRGQLFAVQFHPEKSQHAGLRLLANFLRWDGAY